MKTIRCPRCKQIYEISGLPPECCPECHKKEEEIYNRVKKYIKEHQGATVYETSAATSVSVNKILKYIKEGRIGASSTLSRHNINSREYRNSFANKTL